MVQTVGFFAYGSKPTYSGEAIEEAVIIINNDLGSHTRIDTWKNMNISGKLLIYQIFDKIDLCDYFCADITGANPNVLFELGYAIYRRKPIFIVADTSNEDSNLELSELGILTTVGYSRYSKSIDIVSAFKQEKIYDTLQPLNETIKSISDDVVTRNLLLYIKAPVDTNFSQEISSQIELNRIPVTVDDPFDTRVQKLSWYIGHIRSTPAVLVEFSTDLRAGSTIHNKKCAIVAGLAFGAKREVKLISEFPYDTPVDFKEFFSDYRNREQVRIAVVEFLNHIQLSAATLLAEVGPIGNKRERNSSLRQIRLGEFIAEHESTEIQEYYVETNHYDNILRNEYNIIIGRKGSGKTATYYYLKNTLETDVRNVVVDIKPISFEIHGIVALLTRITEGYEKGHLIESIWKFLIYSEVAKHLYRSLEIRPDHSLSIDERNFLKYVNKVENIILTDFSSRLEDMIEGMDSLLEWTDQRGFKEQISNILHENILAELRKRIKRLIRKGGKLVILIDNLDKAWRHTKDLDVLSGFILGLLSVVGRVAKDLRPYDKSEKFSFHLIIFLRSDIFKYILSIAREPDKIEYTKLTMNDSKTYERIVSERFNYYNRDLSDKGFSVGDFISDEDFENGYLAYILSKTFPRPRDVIYYIKSAKDLAISRGLNKITSSEINDALKEYSSWLFKTLLVENGITVEEMRKFLYMLAGEPQILSKNQIVAFAMSSGIQLDTDDEAVLFIKHLISMSFIGREVRADEFRYTYDFEDEEKFAALASKIDGERYRIHDAVAYYLENTL